jgi:tetratricopeptide (TPR) repeat protein
VKPRRRPLRIALATALLAALLAPGRVPVTRADVPPLLLPPKRDTTSRIESEPAPLLLPGRPGPAEGESRSKATRAREQYVIARALEEQTAFAAAITAYRNALELDPKLRDAHFRVGRLFVRAGQHAAAVSEFAAEVSLDPANTPAARELGLALANAGDTASAIRQLELLTRRAARDTASWKALGYAYGVARRNADAERALRRATALAPGDAGAWRDLGVMVALNGRANEARQAYARAARLDPRDGATWLNLGNLESREGRWPAALAAYREAEARDSTLLAACAGQVNALQRLGRDDELGAVYRRWLAVRPDAPETRIEAIRHFSARGRNDVALELARDGVRANPRSGEAHLALGMALDLSGDTAGMLAELRRAGELLREPEQRQRLAASIAARRARAPDSLRAIYAADSVAHEPGARPAAPAARDSSARR